MLKAHVRWFSATMLLVVVLVFGHAWIINGQSVRTSQLARDDVRISLPYQLIRPEFTVDGHMWIRYAVRLLQGEGPQMRRTDIDNAPNGREIHWNSGYAWWIATWGWCWQKVSALPLTQAVERAAMWENSPLIIFYSALFGIWAFRRSGFLMGLVVTIAIVGHRSLYEGFWPGYADHHGITLASILGLVLGAYWMRGGFLPRDVADAEQRAVWAARWSGFWGAVAMWISAASAVPAIALVAAASLGATVLTRKSVTANYVFSPRVWRNWGAAGAGMSLFFYVLEYFPHHLGWRLEVNHPLFAAAWFAGAELTARLLTLCTDAERAPALRKLLFTALWAVPVAVLPGVVVMIWKARVFLPADPFMIGLHKTITEFLPLLWRLPMEGIWSHYDALILMPTIYVLALLTMLVRGSDRWALIFALGTAVPLHAMGFYQSRWAMSAAPGQVLIVAAIATTLPLVPWLGQRMWRWGVAAALLMVLFYGPALNFRLREAYTFATVTGITAGDGRQLVYREVAQVIRASQPEGEIVLFGSPNTSVNVSFFGDFKTLGTLYWENLEGLRAAAEISSAQSDDEAARLIKARGVTHLAFFRDGNYILEFAKLLNPNITEEQAKQTFGYRLLGARMVPVWLEALPYAAPNGLPEGVDREVLVFKVNFQQRPTEAAYRLGVLQARRQETDDALKTFEFAIKLDQTNYPAALRRAEIFVERKQWAPAQESFDLAIQLAPVGERYRLLTQVGIAFGTSGQRALAIQYYERALREQVGNVISPNNLAWIYSTAADEKLRNPARALELARLCAAQQGENPQVLGTLAAAHAVNLQFDEAVATLDRAMAIARKQQAAQLLPQMEERIAAYRAKKIWLEP